MHPYIDTEQLRLYGNARYWRFTVRTSRVLVLIALAVLSPSAVLAQASIAGIVRDTSGEAFIPGGSWLTPISELSARFAKLSVQFEF